VLDVILILAGVLVILGTGVAFVVSTRRSRGIELEPPPADTADTMLAPPVPVEEAPVVDTPEAPVVDEAVVEDVVATPAPPAVDEALVEEIEEALAPVRPRFRDRLGKARSLLSDYVGAIRSKSKIDQETWDDLEEGLIRADVGVAATTSLIETLRARVDAEGVTDPEQLMQLLKAELKGQLSKGDRELSFEPGATNVWLVVGVNGAGKTTTIGKLAKRQIEAGRRVTMAAGDTFRAAAGEQLETWASRVGADLVRGADGADPASVIFDGIESAAAKGSDLVLADTAGRLHTKVNLMEELRKVRRVAERPPGKVTEVLLVIDAVTGQNGLAQAKQFAEAADVTGVVLTKLDGSAKGGIVFAIQSDLGIPVKLVGLGETADDLVEFDPDEFVEALFS